MVYFELMLIPFAVIVVIFVIFWIVQEGSKWQKHPYLGVFARFIQSTPARAFFTFLLLTIAIVPAILGIMMGVWLDIFAAGGTPSNTTPVVNTLLLMFLMLAGMIPVLWGSFRTWRQSVRSAADVRVRSTQE